MKKSVVITIGIIYALSIMLVTFFGLKHKSFNEIVYVSQIEIIEEKASYLENGNKYFVLTDKVDGVYTYQLNWAVYPDNANNSAVTFIYDTQKSNLSVDENGLVKFTSLGYADSVEITVRSTDGTKQSDKITLIILN